MGVNSFDEWSPLREVVVGSAAGYDAHELDLSFRLFFTAFDDFAGQRTMPIAARYTEELCEDVEELVTALQQAGVTVHRPRARRGTSEIRTPAWRSTTTPALNIRDQAIILGDEIVETAPQVRARYFENDLLKPVFAHYFERGARWTSMPRPVMADTSFDLTRAHDRAMDPGHALPVDGGMAGADTGAGGGVEMMFDAAQCLRLGRDLLVNVSAAHHALGARWLGRHLGERFRVHLMRGLDNNHIDTQVLPLRPGTLLLRGPHVLDHLPEPLRRWDTIYVPEPDLREFPSYGAQDLPLTGLYIDMNVLSLDESTVIVNSQAPRLVKALETRGFTVVPVRHRHRRLFAGGFHCFTLDTVRAGSGPEDYF
ncbi:glycine amidinotransferase [Streptomyces cinnamoneus]|uniref:Inosamine-phosphate amidinotransferase n=1 Tax=Streptomyces cinnamoneus TaxID=53446 RepID=A0A918WD58_STRCJ|nr:glycine amidinotransferase [Streptomyces cinnamoneus]GHC39952.1 inosamine-phosphate amidinotransferase [Streptomyces cinnamoneus]